MKWRRISPGTGARLVAHLDPVKNGPLPAKSRSTHATSISNRLVAVVICATLPLVGVTIFVIDRLAKAERAAQEQTMLASTRALTAAVDGEINRHISVAYALGTSAALKNSDYAEFYRQASGSAEKLQNTWIVLADANGQQLVNTYRSFGQPLPPIKPLDVQQRTLRTGTPQVSGIVEGSVSHTFVAAVFVPVALDDGRKFTINVVLNPNTFFEILERQHLPDGWLGGIIDRDGKFVARTLRQSQVIGSLASSGWLSAAKAGSEGLFDTTSLENKPYRSAYTNSQMSGWSISVGADKSFLDEPMYRSIWLAVIGAVIASLAGICLSLFASRSIVTAMRDLTAAASDLLRGQSPGVRHSGIREVDKALEAFEAASDGISAREQRQQVLLNELNHRVKNTLALVQAMVSLSSRSATSVADFTKTFTARLVALGKTHNLIIGHKWESVPIADIFQTEINVFNDDEMERIKTNGPAVQLSADQAQGLGLVVHELMTNSAKYGGLSVAHGKLGITWNIDNASSRRIHIVWKETDGPAVLTPAKTGFGSRLIELCVQNDLGGKIVTRYLPNGFECDIEFPISDLKPPNAQN